MMKLIWTILEILLIVGLIVACIFFITFERNMIRTSFTTPNKIAVVVCRDNFTLSVEDYGIYCVMKEET